MAWILMICIPHNSPKHNDYLTDKNGPKTYLIIHILNNKTINYYFFLFKKIICGILNVGLKHTKNEKNILKETEII